MKRLRAGTGKIRIMLKDEEDSPDIDRGTFLCILLETARARHMFVAVCVVCV